jgi:hypothetical protein
MRRLILVAVVLSTFSIDVRGQSVPPPVPPPGGARTVEEERAEAERWARWREDDAKLRAKLDAEEARRRANDPEVIRKAAGDASKRYEASLEALRASHERVKEMRRELRKREGNRGRYSESAKVEAIHAFIVELRKLGERVLDDEETLKANFDQFTRISGGAASQFEKAQYLFLRLSNEAEFPQTKKNYLKASEWYASRASDARMGAKAAFPSDYKTEHRRLKEQLKCLRDLEATINVDPYLFLESKGLQELAAFEDYFVRVGEVFDASTNQILEDMTKAKSVAPPTK